MWAQIRRVVTERHSAWPHVPWWGGCLDWQAPRDSGVAVRGQGQRMQSFQDERVLESYSQECECT